MRETPEWQALSVQPRPPAAHPPLLTAVGAQSAANASPPFVQFWRLKARAMDLVLFVRHGSFYNLFDIDCDIGTRAGLNVCGK